MKIVMMNGGLANQCFQYIFGQAVAKLTGDLVIYDDSHFDRLDLNLKHSNGASAQRRQLYPVFGIKYPRLKDLFTTEVYNHMLDLTYAGASVPTILTNEGLEFDFIAETDDHKYAFPHQKFNPNLDLIKSERNIYYHGYWIIKHWYDLAQINLNFKIPESLIQSDLAAKIQLNNAISIHVRRFSKEGYPWDLPVTYYSESVEKFRKEYKSPVFFIFSDDIKWCQEHRDGLGLKSDDSFYVDGNSNEAVNYYDMYLMSISANMILSNSSFSYLSAILNKKKKMFINPIPSRSL